MSLWGERRWPVSLQHGPVGLRPLRVGDEDDWYSVRARNAAWTLPWDATRPAEATSPGLTFRQMVRRLDADARAGRALPWAITWTEPNGATRLVGQLTISGITYGSARWGMAGYWVDRDVAGRGVAPTALALGGDYAFTVVRLHRLEVAIRPENVNSLRVVEKLRFRPEGLRPAYMHVNGSWRDHAMFALHAEEVGAEGLLGRLLSARRDAPSAG